MSAFRFRGRKVLEITVPIVARTEVNHARILIVNDHLCRLSQLFDDSKGELERVGVREGVVA